MAAERTALGGADECVRLAGVQAADGIEVPVRPLSEVAIHRVVATGGLVARAGRHEPVTDGAVEPLLGRPGRHPPPPLSDSWIDVPAGASGRRVEAPSEPAGTVGPDG